MATTTSDINGDYRLAKSGSLVCTPGCSCSLHIEEMDSNGYPAVSASSSSGGTPNGRWWIDFTWRTSGTYSGNNFVLSRVSKRLPTYGSIWRSYYPGAMRVEGDPTRNNNGVHYMLADHLGSTSVTVHLKSNYTLEKRAELRYMPWGENRASGYAESSTPTDRRYTGQIKEDIGLYFYNARWYDPSLGRMAQADTVVPGTGNPLAWDRYAYVVNNPLRYIDPSGHDYLCDEECEDDGWRPPNPVQQAIIDYCKALEFGCFGDKNVTWIGVDMSVLSSELGYDLGIVLVPVHTDVNYSTWEYIPEKGEWGWVRHLTQKYIDDPNLFFPWEGAALTVYSEHRRFYGMEAWRAAAYQILYVMLNRMTNDEKWAWPDYETLNEAALSSFALPQIPEISRHPLGVNDPVFKEFITITIGWLYLDLGITNLGYDFFNHRDTQTCFGNTAGRKNFCIP